MLPPNEYFCEEIFNKQNQYHKELRDSEHKQYRQNIRKQLIQANAIQHLLDNIPKQLQDVNLWAKEMINLLKLPQHSRIQEKTKQLLYEIPPYKTIEVFKIVQKFPNQQTLTMFKFAVRIMNQEGINEMFQYDVIGLLHNILAFPQIATKKELRNQKNQTQQNCQKQNMQKMHRLPQNIKFIQVDVIKLTLEIISQLAENSQRIRNFAVTNHKSFSACLKAYKCFGEDIKFEFINVLYSFTNFTWCCYDEQYLKILKAVLTIAAQVCPDLQRIKAKICLEPKFSEYIVIINKTLCNIVKMNKKWCMDLIDNNNKFENIMKRVVDILQIYAEALENMKQCYCESQSQIKRPFIPESKIICFKLKNVELIDQVMHSCNILIINLLENTLNNYISWERLFAIWSKILTLHFTQSKNQNSVISPSNYELLCNTRRDIYFFVSNAFCEYPINPELSLKLLQKRSIVEIISNNLLIQFREDVLHQISYAITALLTILTKSSFYVHSENIEQCQPMSYRPNIYLQQILEQIYRTNLIENVCEKVMQIGGGLASFSKQLLIKSIIDFHNNIPVNLPRGTQRCRSKLIEFSHSSVCPQLLMTYIDQCLRTQVQMI